MLKAKALCAVNGNLTPEIRPLMSVGEAPVPTADTHGNGLRDLIDDIQNIMIESVGSDEKIPEAVGQLAIKMMKNNDLVKDLLHELRQFYIRGQKDFRLSLAGKSDAEKKQIISLFTGHITNNNTLVIRNHSADRLNAFLNIHIASDRIAILPGLHFFGNAFYQHHGRRYHHGTILVDANMEMMGKYLSPSPAKLQSKGVPSVRSRVINLRELCPELTIPRMKEALTEAFSQVYQLPAEHLSLADLDEKEINVLEERYRSWEWVYGRPLAFTFQCAGKYPWGEITIQLASDGGTVTAAAVYTDAMDPAFVAPLEQAFTGCPFHLPQLYQAVEHAPISQEVRRDICTLLAEQNL